MEKTPRINQLKDEQAGDADIAKHHRELKENKYRYYSIWKLKPSIFEDVLIHYSENKDYEKAKEEWDIDRVIYPTGLTRKVGWVVLEYEHEAPDKIRSCQQVIWQPSHFTFCICTQDNLAIRFYIRNMHNRNILRVGSSCIKKFLPTIASCVAAMESARRKIGKELEKDNPQLDQLFTPPRLCGICRTSIDHLQPSAILCKICWKGEEKKLQQIISKPPTAEEYEKAITDFLTYLSQKGTEYKDLASIYDYEFISYCCTKLYFFVPYDFFCKWIKARI